MDLPSVLAGVEYEVAAGGTAKTVSAVIYDSRKAVPGCLFAAVPGFTADGFRFVGQAVANGAAVIMTERDAAEVFARLGAVSAGRGARGGGWDPAPGSGNARGASGAAAEETAAAGGGGITVIKVPSVRKAMARAAANFYRHPSRQLHLTGVTGTNGKTSITYFLRAILEEAGMRSGIIGTMGALFGGRRLETGLTTPEAVDLQAMLAQMAADGVRHCIMEVSSHALGLDRVHGSRFRSGIFTNLTPEHMELHGTMEQYFRDKAKLFSMVEGPAVVNIDDEYGRRLAASLHRRGARVITCGMGEGGARPDVYPSDVENSARGSRFTVHTPAGSTPAAVNIPGTAYVMNALAAAAWAVGTGIPLPAVEAGLAAVDGIPGRFQTAYERDDFRVVIDFAHTADALEKALKTLRPFVKGNLIVVFGVYAPGGDGGAYKRRAMGRAAARHADFCIVTSDNPRDNDPRLLVAETAAVLEEEQARYEAVVDREEAIRRAIAVSGPSDTILLAGKGHETVQVVGGREVPFDEAGIVLAAVKERLEAAGLQDRAGESPGPPRRGGGPGDSRRLAT